MPKKLARTAQVAPDATAQNSPAWHDHVFRFSGAKATTVTTALRWAGAAKRSGKPTFVLVAPAANTPNVDLFDVSNSVDERARLLAIIAATPHLNWILPTKKMQNAQRMLNAAAAANMQGAKTSDKLWDGAPAENVYLAAVVGNQVDANLGGRRLLRIPAAHRLAICVPLLGSICMATATRLGKQDTDDQPKLDGVILAGDIGPKARPMHPYWVGAIQAWCEASATQFHFAGWGDWVPRSKCHHALPDGSDFSELDPTGARWPVARVTEEGLDGCSLTNCGPKSGGHAYMQMVGSKRAGHLLAGRTHTLRSACAPA